MGLLGERREGGEEKEENLSLSLPQCWVSLTHTHTLCPQPSDRSAPWLGRPYVSPLALLQAAVADGEWLREVEYVQHVADTAKAGQPQIGAIVGSAPVAEGAVNTTYWVTRMMAASPLFRGIRRGLPSPTPNSTSCDYLMGPFLEGVRVLGDHGM